MKELLNLTAAIIAGGKSRRFGTPKALATFGDKTLIEHAICLANSITSATIISTNKENLFEDLNITCVPDIIPDSGPLGGIYSALMYAKTSWVAVLPCDMPLLTANIYSTLRQHLKQNRPTVAVSGNGIEPLVSIWPKSLAGSLKIALEDKRFAIYRMLETLNPVKISISEVLPEYFPEMFFNINRREDLEKLVP